MRNENGQFVKGHPSTRGQKMSDLYRETCRKRQLGKKMSEETKRKMSEAAKKYIHTEEHNKKVSESKLGSKNPMFGKKLSEEFRKRMSEARKGDKSVGWKGGVTPLHESIRKSVEYKLWRESIFKRDKYTCVWCGKIGGNMHADHIKPFAHYPELRFAIDNGRTLCVHCHRTTDTYGSKAKNYVKTRS